ncbi:acyl-CoA thioesterase [Hydrogenophaga luteola]|uniref:Acyl-CoA thioesterase n=1 Tax=Hydrogenophaga luteola TaxID=1591122 RepID=A0ABV7WBK4_9BURK
MAKQTFDSRHLVTFEETNVVGNVYFTNYFLWQGRARELFLREHSPSTLAEVTAGELRLVTAHASCDFVDEFVAFDEVLVRMSLNRFIPFGVSLGFEYGRVPSDTVAYEVVARGRQDIKFLRREGLRWDLFEIPQPLMEIFQRYE